MAKIIPGHAFYCNNAGLERLLLNEPRLASVVNYGDGAAKILVGFDLIYEEVGQVGSGD